MNRKVGYSVAIERRRAFSLGGFKTIAEAGFEGDYVSPIQLISGNLDGPILIAKDWFDYPSAIEHREVLLKFGYMPGIRFNCVLDMALAEAGLDRRDIYLTQAFHLLVPNRSTKLKASDVRASFFSVTQHELLGRRPIALGRDASAVLEHFGIRHIPTVHPSGRTGTNEEKAALIAMALRKA